MNILSKILLVGTLACSATQHADALSISLEPSGQTIGVGGHASLNIVISGLTLGTTLGAFDLELSYDSSLLSVDGIGFGTGLDLGNNSSIQYSDLTTPGVIVLSELSLESAADLIGSAQSTFTLATLDLIGLAPGTSPIAFTWVDLSDQDGGSLTDFTSIAAAVTVTDGSTAVGDTTSSLYGLLASVAGLACVRRFGKP